MEQAAIALIMWLHGVLSVQAQGFEPAEQRRIKAVQACMVAMSKGDGPADRDVIPPPWGGLPSGDPVADADWLIRRAAEGHVAGYGTVKVIHYDADANRVFLIHEAPRPAPQLLRLGVPLGGF